MFCEAIQSVSRNGERNAQKSTFVFFNTLGRVKPRSGGILLQKGEELILSQRLFICFIGLIVSNGCYRSKKALLTY